MLSVLAALGVTVIAVDDMPDPVCWVESQRVGLVRAGLPAPALDVALGWIADEALALAVD